jgi:putative transposase
MRLSFNINKGDRALIDGVEYVLHRMIGATPGALDRGDDDFQFEELRTGRIRIFPKAEFLSHYEAGKVRLLTPTERLTDRTPEPGEDEGDPKRLAKARRRLGYLKAYDAEPCSLSTAKLQQFIRRIGLQLGDPAPPSAGAVRRWLRQRGVPGQRFLNEMLDRHPRGRRPVRLEPRVQQIVAEEARKFADIQVSPQDVWDKVVTRVEAENLAVGSAPKTPMRAPARSTVWEHLKRNLTYDIAEARWGAGEARRRFSVIRGSMQADALLDIATIDHTILDWVLIDEVTGQPIGRPRLSVMLDSCSRYPLGFNLGWRDASVEAVMACLRHAVRPKGYVRERYPHIKNEWLAYGLPRTLKVDQGLEFMGSSLDDAAATLGFSIEPAPVRTPEWKGQIERFFGTANTGLFHKAPGGVPFKPHQLKALGLDPEASAVLTLSEAEAFIHEWFIDVYARRVHRELGAAPAKVWLDHLRTDPIELARDLSVLDRACTAIKGATLTREGVSFMGLKYRSEAVAQLRLELTQALPAAETQRGGISAPIKYQPEDLGRVWIWSTARRDYVELPCTTPKYAQGLSEHLHHHLRGWARAENRAFQSEGEMCAARVALRERMDALVPKRVRDRKRLQRLRHREREAQADLVRMCEFDEAPASPRVPGGALVPIATHRADGTVEPRAPLGGRKQPRSGRSMAGDERFVSAGPAPTPFSQEDWNGAIAEARRRRETDRAS